MKRALLMVLTTVILSSAASAELLPARGYISLYADESRSYSAYCPLPAGYLLAKVDVWVWCLPSENGLWGAEFAIGYPSNVISDRVTLNGDLSTATGDLLSGISARFDECQWDWCWIAHQTLYVNSREQTYLEVVSHSGSGVFQLYSCSNGHPAEPCLKGTNLYLNSAAPCLTVETEIGTEESTWGLLKSLFTE
ncbi:MAG: hypothetical protein PHD74_00615 [Candidatus Krumholzibacteria bacterium]|nr:hypothetical protein [Candidatus Krumholzibacteria bacterium]